MGQRPVRPINEKTVIKVPVNGTDYLRPRSLMVDRVPLQYPWVSHGILESLMVDPVIPRYIWSFLGGPEAFMGVLVSYRWTYVSHS